MPEILLVTATDEKFLIVEEKLAENNPCKDIGFGSPTAHQVLNDGEQWQDMEPLTLLRASAGYSYSQYP